MQCNTIQPFKKKEILPFSTAWLDLEDIMLSEVSQIQKNMSYLYVESKIV